MLAVTTPSFAAYERLMAINTTLEILLSIVERESICANTFATILAPALDGRQWA
jgi:hypothetical protein